jgi:hypothetical protein
VDEWNFPNLIETRPVCIALDEAPHRCLLHGYLRGAEKQASHFGGPRQRRQGTRQGHPGGLHGIIFVSYKKILYPLAANSISAQEPKRFTV